MTLEPKEGEVWVITFEGKEYAGIFQAGRFRDMGGSWYPEEVTDARRIYPEGGSK